MNNAGRILNNIFKILVLLICIYAFVFGLFNSVVIVRNGVRFNSSYIHFGALLAVALIMIGLSYVKKVDNKIEKGIYIILFILISITFLVSLKLSFFNENDDAMVCMNIANNLYEKIKFGNPIIFDSYVERTPHQIGLILFETLLMLISKNNFETLFYFINLISLLGTYCFFIKILKLLKAECKLSFILLVSLWIVPLLLMRFYYGWHVGLFFTAFSIYNFLLFLSEKKYQFILVSLLALMAASFIKPNFSIVYIAYLITLVGVKVNKKFLMLILTSCVFFISTNISSVLVKNIYPMATKDPVPMIGWLVMGGQKSDWGNGWYNGYVNQVFANSEGNKELMSKQINSDLAMMVSEKVSHPVATLQFYVNKMNDLVLNKDFQLHSYYVMGRSIENNNEILIGHPGLDITYFINEIFYNLLLLGIITYELTTLHNKKSSFALLELCFLGGFAYHLLFEAKGLYMFPWFTLLLPLSAMGLSEFTLIYNKRRKWLNIYIIVGIACLGVVSLVFNPKTYEHIFYENYSNDQNQLSLARGNYISQPFILKENRIISSVDILTNGHIPSQGTIGLEVYENDKMILQKYYDTSVLTDFGWCNLPIGTLPIIANKNYYLKLYSNIEDKSFSLIVGQPSINVDNNLSLNGYVKDQVINFKLSETYKQQETESYIFDSYYKSINNSK